MALKIDKIIAEYDLKLAAFKKDIGTIKKGLKSTETQSKKSAAVVSKSYNGLNSAFATLGVTIGAAFAVSKIKGFLHESIELFEVTQGIEAAFVKLNKPGLLKEIQKATKDTVSDMSLMQKAVQAQNFKIPLESLASLFEFATKRAQDTGESVDFLVNSIVLGIGRKSPLILDNLGISAVSLREKLDELGRGTATVGDIAQAVGKIAQEEMAKAGDIIHTAAIATAQMKASVANLKVEIGENMIPVQELWVHALLEWSNIANELVTSEEGFKGFEKFLDTMQDITNVATPQVQTWEALRKVIFRNNESIKLLVENIQDGLVSIEDVEKRIGNLPGMDLFIEQLKELAGITSEGILPEPEEQITTIKLLKEELKTLNELIENSSIETAKLNPLIRERNALEDRLEKLLGKQDKQANKVKTLTEQRKLLIKARLEGRDIDQSEILALDAKIRAETELNKEIKEAISLLDQRHKLQTEGFETTKKQTEGQLEFATALDKTTDKIGENIDKELEFDDQINELRDLSQESEIDRIQRLQDLNKEALEKGAIDYKTFIEYKKTLDADLLQFQIDNFERLANATSTLLTTIAKMAKDGSDFQKALAIADIVVTEGVAIAKGVQLVAESSSTPLDYAVNLISVVGSIISAFVGISSILEGADSPSVPTFAEGGYTGDGNTFQEAGIVHKKEYVVPAEPTSMYMPELEAMRKGQYDSLVYSKYINPEMSYARSVLQNLNLQAELNDSRLLKKLSTANQLSMTNTNRLVNALKPNKLR